MLSRQSAANGVAHTECRGAILNLPEMLGSPPGLLSSVFSHDENPCVKEEKGQLPLCASNNTRIKPPNRSFQEVISGKEYLCLNSDFLRQNIIPVWGTRLSNLPSRWSRHCTVSLCGGLLALRLVIFDTSESLHSTSSTPLPQPPLLFRVVKPILYRLMLEKSSA